MAEGLGGDIVGQRRFNSWMAWLDGRWYLSMLAEVASGGETQGKWLDSRTIIIVFKANLAKLSYYSLFELVSVFHSFTVSHLESS